MKYLPTIFLLIIAAVILSMNFYQVFCSNETAIIANDSGKETPVAALESTGKIESLEQSITNESAVTPPLQKEEKQAPTQENTLQTDSIILEQPEENKTIEIPLQATTQENTLITESIPPEQPEENKTIETPLQATTQENTLITESIPQEQPEENKTIETPLQATTQENTLQTDAVPPEQPVENKTIETPLQAATQETTLQTDAVPPEQPEENKTIEPPLLEKPISPLLTEDVKDSSSDYLTLKEENSFKVFLNTVTKYVTTNNPVISEAYLTWQSKRKQAKASFGDFEPALALNSGKNSLKRENNAQELLQQNFNPTFSETNYEYGAGIGGKFFSGTNYNFGYTNKRLKNSLTTSIQYESFLGVTAEQPLLKGLWYQAPTSAIRITGKEETIAFNTYRKQLMETVAQAEAYYWNLAYAQELYRISDESVAIAQKIFKDSQEQVQAGKLSETDLVQAKAELKNRFAERNKAYQNLLEASTNLKLLLSVPEIPPGQILIAADPLVPVSNEAILQPEEIKETNEDALKTQPDIVIKRQEIEREQIRLSYYRSQRLPDLNLKSSYGYNGLGLTSREAWDKVNERNYPAWSVLLEMKIPFLGGIRERNELKAARLNTDIAAQRLKATEYELSRSSSSLQQRLQSLASQTESTKTTAECKSLILEIGISRFQEGKINIWEIYRLEEDLFAAKKEELETRLRYKEAALQLRYIQGLILLDKGIEKMENGKFVLTTKGLS